MLHLQLQLLIINYINYKKKSDSNMKMCQNRLCYSSKHQKKERKKDKQNKHFRDIKYIDQRNKSLLEFHFTFYYNNQKDPNKTSTHKLCYINTSLQGAALNHPCLQLYGPERGIKHRVTATEMRAEVTHRTTQQI